MPMTSKCNNHNPLGHQTGRLGSGSRRMTSFCNHPCDFEASDWLNKNHWFIFDDQNPDFGKIRNNLTESQVVSFVTHLHCEISVGPLGTIPLLPYELSDHLRGYSKLKQLQSQNSSPIFLFQDMIHPWFSMGKMTISSHKNLTTTTINTDSLLRTKTHAASGNLGLESLMAARRSDFLPTFCFWPSFQSLGAWPPQKKTISSNMMNHTIQLPYICLESILSRLLTPYAIFFLCREAPATPTIACCSICAVIQKWLDDDFAIWGIEFTSIIHHWSWRLIRYMRKGDLQNICAFF